MPIRRKSVKKRKPETPVLLSPDAIEKALQEKARQAKKKEELVFPVLFTVDKASYHTGAYSHHNGVMGPGGYSTRTGIGLSANFEVTPQDSSIPIRTLSFAGYASVRAGDAIRAYVPRFRTETDLTKGICCEAQEALLYFDREFTASEKAYKIERVDEKGKVLEEFEGLED